MLVIKVCLKESGRSHHGLIISETFERLRNYLIKGFYSFCIFSHTSSIAGMAMSISQSTDWSAL